MYTYRDLNIITTICRPGLLHQALRLWDGRDHPLGRLRSLPRDTWYATVHVFMNSARFLTLDIICIRIHIMLLSTLAIHNTTNNTNEHIITMIMVLLLMIIIMIMIIQIKHDYESSCVIIIHIGRLRSLPRDTQHSVLR